MWKLLVILSLSTSTLAAPSTADCTEKQIAKFAVFKKSFKRNYATPEQEASALRCFCNADNEIEKHNADPDKTYELGHNDRSDNCMKVQSADINIDETEAKPIKFGEKNQEKKVKASGGSVGFVKINGGKNWANRTGLVRNQGGCGNCWAHGANSVIQFYRWMETNKTDELSVSNLVDCNPKGSGCGGGDPGTGLQYAKDSGVALESKYPTVETQQKCKISKTLKAVYKLKKNAAVAKLNGDEDTLLMGLDTLGPMVVAIYSSCNSFIRYKTGVYNDKTCTGTKINHAVVLVGYGTTKKTKTQPAVDYWIIKNSWGEVWGENGYGKIIRGKNLLGIGTVAFVPCPDGADC